MIVTPRSILVVIAILIFIAAAVLPPASSRIGLVPAGLAFLAAGLLGP